jgi:hypothetical protein
MARRAEEQLFAAAALDAETSVVRLRRTGVAHRPHHSTEGIEQQ